MGICFSLLCNAESEFANDGQFLGLAVGGIDNAQDGQHREQQINDNEHDAEHGIEFPRNSREDLSNQPNGEPDDAQDESLVSVEPRKLGVFSAKDGNEHQDAQIGQDGHDFVLLNVVLGVLGSGVGRVVQGGDFLFQTLLLVLFHNNLD